MAAAEVQLPVFEFEDGRRFIADSRETDGSTPFDGMSPDEIRTLVATLWSDAYNSKRGEIERLKQNSLYYDGFHYANAWMNRINAVTNRIYALVEAQVALAVAQVPRPEIVARGGADPELAERLNLAAEWIEDADEYDQAIYLGARDKFIYGYNIWLVSFDYATGMPFPKNLSVFDFYRDPAARNEDEMTYCFVAMPVSTYRLRATYPNCVDENGETLIQPDRIASPSYDVIERPWAEFMENSGTYGSHFTPDTALAAHREGEQGSGTVVSLVADTGVAREWGQTTFLMQLLIKDEAMAEVTYTGTWESDDPLVVSSPGEYKTWEPRTPSGWWLLSLTGGDGIFLHDPVAVDDCFMGLPLVFDRNHQRTDRFESMCEVDHSIPIQRELNRRKALMMRALELSANPPLFATVGAGISADKGTIAGGEIITGQRGATIQYLEYRGPAAQQFEMYGTSERDMESVAGVPDVQRGIKPAGIEAAAAIRKLDENSMRRMEGKENPAHRARARLLKKIFYCAGKKLQQELIFNATNGEVVAIANDELCADFRVRYARGSGMPDGRRELEEKAFLLFEKGIFEPIDLLNTLRIPGRKKIAERAAARLRAEKMLEILSAQKAGDEEDPSTQAA